jgi:hypothetical protein
MGSQLNKEDRQMFLVSQFDVKIVCKYSRHKLKLMRVDSEHCMVFNVKHLNREVNEKIKFCDSYIVDLDEIKRVLGSGYKITVKRG